KQVLQRKPPSTRVGVRAEQRSLSSFRMHRMSRRKVGVESPNRFLVRSSFGKRALASSSRTPPCLRRNVTVLVDSASFPADIGTVTRKKELRDLSEGPSARTVWPIEYPN